MDENSILSAFSSHLKQIREQKAISLQDFSNLCNISSVYTLHNYLYGNSLPPVSTVIKICNVFNISPNYLFEGVIDYPTEQQIIKDCYPAINCLFGENSHKLSGVIRPLIECIFHDPPNIGEAKFDTRLRVIREEASYSQIDLSERCGIEPGTLKLHESEQRYPKTTLFLKYSRELGVSPEYLLCNYLNIGFIFDKRMYALTPRKIRAVSMMAQEFFLFYNQ